MRGARFKSLVVLAAAVSAPVPNPGGAVPSMIWKGIQEGPGPIYPAGPSEPRPPAPVIPPTPAPSSATDAPPAADPFRVGTPSPR